MENQSLNAALAAQALAGGTVGSEESGIQAIFQAGLWRIAAGAAVLVPRVGEFMAGSQPTDWLYIDFDVLLTSAKTWWLYNRSEELPIVVCVDAGTRQITELDVLRLSVRNAELFAAIEKCAGRSLREAEK